jgi:hypothetical protein
MAYDFSTDFVGLWRAVTGGAQKGEIPALDLIISALSRSGLINVSISETQPVVNQSTTMWFAPASPSYSAEGVLKLWNGSAYVTATPALFNDYLAAVG